MSNPSTISKALKYIPELQQQVEGLRRRKEGLVTKLNEENLKQIRKNNKEPWMSSLCAVNWLSETEALLQIALEEQTHTQLPFSQILLSLEDDGLLLSTASSFRSSNGSLFFTLLLQVCLSKAWFDNYFAFYFWFLIVKSTFLKFSTIIHVLKLYS